MLGRCLFLGGEEVRGLVAAGGGGGGGVLLVVRQTDRQINGQTE
jgi:hypothetical protein